MEFVSVHCGGCDSEIVITEGQYRNDDVAACNKCGAGADLIHARRHADDF